MRSHVEELLKPRRLVGQLLLSFALDDLAAVPPDLPGNVTRLVE
jgi:hypothetical protein